MLVDVYKNCPSYENEFYILRMTSKEDNADLLKVYSDEKAVPFFNASTTHYNYLFCAKVIIMCGGGVTK